MCTTVQGSQKVRELECAGPLLRHIQGRWPQNPEVRLVGGIDLAKTLRSCSVFLCSLRDSCETR